jgi:hypothetical protein
MKTVEAEGGELVIQNDAGDTAIIPKNKRQQALKMLEDGNHSGIDELVSNLPYKEDYAQDGTLIPDFDTGKPPLEPIQTKASTIEGLQEQGLGQVTPELEIPKVTQDLATLEELEPYREEFGEGPVAIPEGRYLKTKEAETQLAEWKKANEAFAEKQLTATEPISAPFNIPNPGVQGCLGSACRLKIGDMPSYYDIRQGAGIFTVQTGEQEELGSGYESIDSWELAGVAEETGIGKNWMTPSKGLDDFSGEFAESDFESSMQKDRAKAAKDFQNVPVGAILSSGLAEGVYTEKGAKTILKQRGKKPKEITQKVRPRHSIRYWGIDPDSGDYLFYDYGKLEKVKPDEESVEQFLNDKGVMYITSLKDQGDWSKAKLERAQKYNRSISK